jgi:hypothetical protein
MKTKIIHPLWIHLPAVMVILALIIMLLISGPLPEQAPIHFDSSGQPDSYGSPLIVIIMILLMMILFLAISGMIDELWARQEKKKTFNWLSLFDDFIVGGLGGVTIGYLGVLSESIPVFEFPWIEVVLVCGSATLLAVILEIIRPYRKYEFAVAAENIDGIKSDIDNIIKSGQPLIYWESQNPIYNSVLAVVLPLIFIGVAIATSFLAIWVSVLYVVLALLSFMMYGGFRTIVNQDVLVIKLGVVGIPLLNINMADITAIETHSFSPLKDFGGCGIRINREMKAYFLSGNRGVKLTMNDGKKYLIGSDYPERLATVIKALRR